MLLCDLDDGGHAHFVDLVAVDIASDVPPAPPTEPDLPVRALHLEGKETVNVGYSVLVARVGLFKDG